MRWDNDSTYFLYICYWCIPTPVYCCIQVWGCIVYYRKVLSEPLFDKRNQLHTFFFIIIHLGVEWFWIGNKFKTYMLMNRNEQGVYLIPKIEMQLIKVEKGFVGSLESPEPDGEL